MIRPAALAGLIALRHSCYDNAVGILRRLDWIERCTLVLTNANE